MINHSTLASDKHFRLLHTASFISRLIKSDHDTILDAGSGENLLTRYVKSPITNLDCKYFKGHPPTVVGSFINLPFRSNSFDVVTCIDALEHIPPSRRSEAISELSRCAKTSIIFTFPINNTANHECELTLNRIENVLRGSANVFLLDHLEFGLVDPNIVTEELRTQFKHVKSYPSFGTLPWFFISLIEAVASIIPCPESIQETLRSLFNHFACRDKIVDPYYRILIAASNTQLPDKLPLAASESPMLDHASILQGFQDVYKLQSDLSNYASDLSKRIPTLESRILVADQEMEKYRVENQQFQEFIQSLAKQLKEKTEQLDEQKERQYQIESQLNQKSQFIKDLSTEYNQVTRVLCEKQDQIKNLEKAIHCLQSEIGEKNNFISELSEEYSKLTQIIREKQEHIQNLDQVILDHQVEIMRKTKHIGFLSDEYGRLESRLLRSENRRRDWIRQLKRLRSKLADKDVYITEIQKNRLIAILSDQKQLDSKGSDT